jgi:hypothetical protein
MKSGVLKDKVRVTMLSRYGVEHALQNPDIKKNVEDLFMKKYGVSSPLAAPVVQAKIKETNFQRYGVGHIVQRHISPETIELLNDPDRFNGKDGQTLFSFSCARIGRRFVNYWELLETTWVYCPAFVL